MIAEVHPDAPYEKSDLFIIAIMSFLVAEFPQLLILRGQC